MTNLPVACTLTPDALRDRRQGLLSDLVRGAEHELLADGLRLRFDASTEMLSTIMQAVDAERQCCRFLRFVIAVEPDGGPISVELTGPRGTREFLTALLETRSA